MIHADFVHYVQDRLHRYREQLRYQESLPPAISELDVVKRHVVQRELQACIGELEHLLERLRGSEKEKQP